MLVPLVTILHQGYGAAEYSAEVAIALNSQQPLDSNLGTGKKFLFSAELGGSKKIVQPVIKQQNLTSGAIKREGKCRRLILYHLLRKKSTNRYYTQDLVSLVPQANTLSLAALKQNALKLVLEVLKAFLQGASHKKINYHCCMIFNPITVALKVHFEHVCE